MEMMKMSEKCQSCNMRLLDENGQGSGDEGGYCWDTKCQSERAESAEAERDNWRTAYELAAENRKAEAALVEQMRNERDAARYEAMMEASRAVYDMAKVYRDAGDTQEYSALIQAFNKIVTSKAANP